MRADQLGRILQRIVHATVPVTSVLVAAGGTSGCIVCGTTTDEDVHGVSPPSGWTVEGDTLRDPPGDVYKDGDRDSVLCQTFCSGDVQDCTLIYCGDSASSDPDCGGSTFAIRCVATVEESCGRRPVGLRSRRRAVTESPLAAYLADCAHLEAASVDAFEILRSELAAHRAPKCLRRAASRAASDERRHARTLGALARRASARCEKPAVSRPSKPRALLDIALENAREGNVFETYGALVAQWQARHGTDRRLRAAYRTISRDEARHAALSFRVAAWIEPLLDDTGRAQVAAARAHAVDELRARLLREPAPEVAALAGVPSASVGRALFDRLADALAL